VRGAHASTAARSHGRDAKDGKASRYSGRRRKKKPKERKALKNEGEVAGPRSVGAEMEPTKKQKETFNSLAFRTL